MRRLVVVIKPAVELQVAGWPVLKQILGEVVSQWSRNAAHAGGSPQYEACDLTLGLVVDPSKLLLIAV